MTNLTQGDDNYNGSAGDDIVNGLGGNDTINGNAGDDQLNGGGGDDILNGGANDDQLTGGSGNDTLTGGIGDDILTGGSGTDTAVINASGANGIGSHNGAVTSVLTSDGLDQLTQVEFIQFNNGTVQIVNGNAQAYLGADTDGILQQGSASHDAGTGVLSNDFDIDDSMTLTGIHSNNENADGSLGSALAGQYGSLTLNADGSYIYNADASTNTLGVGETATDVFTYTVHSGGTDFTQTLSIVITGTNDDPSITSAVGSASYNDTLADDTFVTTTGTLTASDVDAHDTLTFDISGSVADTSQAGFDHSFAGLYGTLYINASTGAYEYIANDAAMEALKTNASETFTFTVSDGHGGTDTQDFTVTVHGVNDRPTLAAIPAMSYTDTSADDVFATKTGNLVGGDRDAGDTLTYHAVGEALDGSQTGFDHAVAGTYGTLYFNATTGAYEYIPNDGAIEGLKTDASETFSFSATDGALNSPTRVLTVTLHGNNDTPDMNATTPTATLIEDGGVANGTTGVSSSFSTVSMTDRDTGDVPTFDSAALTGNGWIDDGGGMFHKVGTYGTATLNTGTGLVCYALDNNDSDTQGLNNGDIAHDIFTIYGTDGTAHTSINVDFTIDGSNDNAVISGTLNGSATEAGGVNNGTAGSPATGTATDTDVDNPINTFSVGSGTSDNGYGTYTVDASGHWVFTVNEGDDVVQGLNVGQSTTDSFTIHTADGTSQVISIIIQGANDAAVVSGAMTGGVIESGGPLAPGNPNASGTLTDTDVDNTDNLFCTNSGSLSDTGYGTYTIDSSGHWTFTLNNSLTAIQALNDGDHVTETFTVETIDGTQQVISIVIDGHNEVFNGTAGNNNMTGTIWGDTFNGGDGNDTYRINNTADRIVENPNQGFDTAQATVSYTLDANVEALIMSGHGNIDGTGNALANTIVGNAGDNVLSGLGGDDVMSGAAGNDTLKGGDGDDNMDGGSGIDTASYADAGSAVTVSLALTGFQNTGGAGTDKLANIENLVGSGSDDTLSGNGGTNAITGGGGADTMTGGLGHDTFIYTSATDSTLAHSDTITDLQNNVDFIDLSALGTDFSIVNSFTNSADQITLHYDSGTHITTIAIDLNGDGVADMQILASGDHHTFNDFIGLAPA